MKGMSDREQILNVGGVVLMAILDRDWAELSMWMTNDEQVSFRHAEYAHERFSKLRDDLVSLLGGGDMGEAALMEMAGGFLRSASGETECFLDLVPDGIHVETPYRRLGSRFSIGLDAQGQPVYAELELVLVKEEGYWHVVCSELEGYVGLKLI